MKKHFFFFSGFTLISVTSLLSGCYKEPTFDFKPNIEFSDIRKEIILEAFSGAKTDSVIVDIKFQDGDGDLGQNEIDKAKAAGNFNYIVKIFEKKKGVYIEKIQTEPYSGVFPRLKTSGKAGPIEGVLNYSMNFQQPFIPRNDTLKFQIYIKDRAGNSSNTIETAPIVLHEF
jgi:hypothetical protein